MLARLLIEKIGWQTGNRVMATTTTTTRKQKTNQHDDIVQTIDKFHDLKTKNYETTTIIQKILFHSCHSKGPN